MKRLSRALLLVASLLFLVAGVGTPAYPAAPTVPPATHTDRAALASQGDSRAFWERLLNDSRREARKSPTSEVDPNALFWVAVSAANLGRLDESTESFRQLQSADPGRRVEQSIVAECRSVLDQDSENLKALNGLAFVAYAKEDYAQSASFFQVLVSLEATNPWTRNYLGFSLGKAGRIDEAVRVLEEGTRLFPENEVTHFLLGLAYYEKGWVMRALGQLAKAPRAIRYFR